MASSTSNPRASLLAGLRTGGVRSASQPFPASHSTAPLNGQFNIPRVVSSVHPSHAYLDEEEEVDQLTEMTSQFTFEPYNDHQAPMTASAIDSNFLFQQQQQQQQLQQQQMLLNHLAAQRAGLAGNVYNANGQQIDLRTQMMQMELLKYQVMQQQSQYQAEFAAQAQAQVQRQMQSTQSNYTRNLEPVTAAPNITSFDHRANAIAQLRARQLERLSIPMNDEFISSPISGPMTASIDGKFGSRALNPHAASFMSRFGDQEGSLLSPLQSSHPSRTTVISGGTSLGSAAIASPMTPSKSDAATSWRRGVVSPATPSRASPVTNSVLRSLRGGISEETGKNRPQPLNLHQDNFEVTSHIQCDTVNEDDPTSGSSKTGSPTSASTPATPPPVQPVLSTEPKKSYENLGVGRPTVVNVVNAPRFVSLPSRQPKGPPSGADELGPRNFASRIRRQAIGGLGALVNAREQRELAVEVQAY